MFVMSRLSVQTCFVGSFFLVWFQRACDGSISLSHYQVFVVLSFKCFSFVVLCGRERRVSQFL